jgi:hypothetical protein
VAIDWFYVCLMGRAVSVAAVGNTHCRSDATDRRHRIDIGVKSYVGLEVGVGLIGGPRSLPGDHTDGSRRL